MKIQIEGVSLEKGVLGSGGMPPPQELLSELRSDPARILTEETLLRSRVETSEEGQSFIRRQSHDMAFARERPEFEGEARAERRGSRDHLGTGQMGPGSQAIELEANQVRQEKKESPALGGKTPGRQGKGAHIGDGLDGGTRPLRTFLIATAG